jgi:hypothetical protein
MQPSHTTFFDEASLAHASDIIRDAMWSEQDFALDQTNKAKLVLWKADEELVRVEGRWRFSPMRRIELFVAFVESSEMVRNLPGLPPHPVGGLRWTANNLTLVCYDGIQLAFRASKLSGSVRVTEEVDFSRIEKTRAGLLKWPFR